MMCLMICSCGTASTSIRVTNKSSGNTTTIRTESPTGYVSTVTVTPDTDVIVN